MVLKKVYRKSTGRFEYVLISKANPKKILFYFGPSKPSKSEFLRQERRIAYFKNLKGKKNFGSFSKRKVWIRRKDRVKQRYWKNYGSQIIRQRIRKDLPFLSDEKIKDLEFSLPSPDKILPSTHRRGELVRTFEKNPELYKEFIETNKPKILFIKGEPSRTHPRERVILISDPTTRGWLIYNPKIGEQQLQGVESDLRHELKHLSDFDIVGEFDKWKEDIPYSLKESSAKSAEGLSTRRKKVSKKIIEYNINQFLSDKNGL